VHHFSKADKAVAASFGGYWHNFAATGDPNGDGVCCVCVCVCMCVCVRSYVICHMLCLYNVHPLDTQLVAWPEFQPSTSEVDLIIDAAPTTEADLYSKQCDMWDTITPQ
jgi:hypothetical protein